MDILVEKWNSEFPEYNLTYEKRNWYENGKDNEKYILRIYKNNEIVREIEGKSFLEAYAKIKEDLAIN